MRQRLGLAAAMLGDPAVLVLDEPTNGLDPPGVRWLRGYVRRLADEGRTVLLSSHALSEVELTADHVLVLAQGRLLRSSTLAEFRAEAGVGSRVRTPVPDRLGAALDAAGHAYRLTDEGLAVDAPPEQVGEIAAAHGVVLHRLAGNGRTSNRPSSGSSRTPITPRNRNRPRRSVVKALVLAEQLKLRTTRTQVALLLATLAFVPLTAALTIPKEGAENAPVSLDDPRLLAVAVGDSFGVPLVLMVLLGGVAFTQEFRYGTITSTYLVEPRRTRVLVAKWVTLALVGAVVTTLTLLVSVPVSAALIGFRGGEVSFGATFWR